MSSSYSDCFSDLICEEDAGILADVESPDFQEIEFPTDIEESIAGFIQVESEFSPARFQSQSLDVSARQDFISWILKVQAFYGFQALTVYLSVNYMDRFLASRVLPQTSGWPLQLLSIACLSLAAKMEEPLVPSLLDLQVEGTKYFFEPRTIRRMEFLVLDTLNWKLRSITPFTFIDFFASKVDSTGTCIGFLISRATEIILATIKETRFLQYPQSSVAAASVLHAASEFPSLSLVSTPTNAVSWCQGLIKVRTYD
ncbi:hypothetical protein ACHQM5_008431 [Ranunculus cassubicifolius]